MITRAEQAELVRAWNEAPDATHDPAVRKMIDAEVRRIHQAFEKLPFEVVFVDDDPYSSFEHMRDQVQSTGRMLVWKGASDTPLWTPETNWRARAVHDWDHIVKSCDFSMEGEAMAYRVTAACTPGLAPLYLSEIMLQAAIFNYEGSFVPQKLVIVPEYVRRKATAMRGLEGDDTAEIQRGLLDNRGRGGKVYFDTRLLELVWLTAGILRTGSNKSALAHLYAMGLPREQAFVVLDAASRVNDRADQAYRLRR